MTRPWRTWAVFGICFAVVFASVTWITLAVLQLDAARAQAQRQADFEEKMRLALWRMDSLLTPLIVEESARPALQYEAFHGTGRVYTKTYTALDDVLVPSPLLMNGSSNVLLHFQLAADGTVTSPEVPVAAARALATNEYTTSAALEIAAGRLEELKALLASAPGSERAKAGSQAGQRSNLDELRAIAKAPAVTNVLPLATRNAPLAQEQQREQAQRADPLANASPAQVAAANALAQSFRNSAEWNARQAYQQLAVQADAQPASAARHPNPAPERLLQPAWIGSALMLVRRAEISGSPVVQGVWLNWPQLKPMLLGTIADLLPNADLLPVRDTAAFTSRSLAAIPVAVAAAPARARPGVTWTPLRWSLVAAWACLLLATLAVAVLLYGAVSLSERRAAFVSAVTHELRTPLTTFQMYSEMLAAGMVPDEARRAAYLNTLCSEANRLTHLVENVLAYARLERGSARRRVERLTLGELVERVRGRLEERAARSDRQLRVDVEPAGSAAAVQVDVAAIEQILFNLVDNACKYANGTTERGIHLEALPDGKFAMLRVRDHGQGISPDAAKRLFRPFSKSAHEAANSAPGIGLGLALCRRLSRSIGGDLRLDRRVAGGACFELRLPLTGSGPCALHTV